MNHLIINGNSNFKNYSSCKAGNCIEHHPDQFFEKDLRITSPGVQLLSTGYKPGKMGSNQRNTIAVSGSRKNYQLAAPAQVLSSFGTGFPRHRRQANNHIPQIIQIRIRRYYALLQKAVGLEATILRYFGANSSFTRITLEEAPQPTAGRMSKPSGGTGPNIPLPERFRKSSNYQFMNEKVLAIVTLVGVFFFAVMVDLWSKRIDRKKQEKARKEYKQSRIGGRS